MFRKIKSKYQPYLVIAIAVLAVYISTLYFGYTYLDDNALIIAQQKFLSNFGNVWQAFGKDVFFSAQNQAYYRPLFTVSLMFDTLWGGGNAWAYHLSNVLIHLVAVWLLFATLIKLGYRRSAGLIAGLIFAVHPVLTQAVAWLPGRNDSLLAVFALASFYFVIDDKRWSATASVVFFGLALFTKETALVLPAMFLLYRWLVQRKKIFSLDNFYLLAGYILGLLVWLPLRQTAFNHPLNTDFPDLVRSGFANLPAVLLYLGKIIFPFNLTVLPNLKDSDFVWGSLSIVLLIMFAAFRLFMPLKKSTYEVDFLGRVWFGIIWFVVLLAPSFIRPNTEIMPDFLDHRAYLAFFGILIVFLELGLKNIKLKKQSHLYFVSAIVIGLSLVTFFHSQKFANRVVFWENAVSGSPSSPLAHRNLGAMYYLDGAFTKAKPHFEKALELNKTEQMAHNNLGLIYLSQNELEQAQKEFEAEISVNPDWETANFNLGLVFARLNKNDDAKAMWLKTLEINPNYTDAKQALRTLAK